MSHAPADLLKMSANRQQVVPMTIQLFWEKKSWWAMLQQSYSIFSANGQKIICAKKKFNRWSLQLLWKKKTVDDSCRLNHWQQVVPITIMLKKKPVGEPYSGRLIFYILRKCATGCPNDYHAIKKKVGEPYSNIFSKQATGCPCN